MARTFSEIVAEQIAVQDAIADTINRADWTAPAVVATRRALMTRLDALRAEMASDEVGYAEQARTAALTGGPDL